MSSRYSVTPKQHRYFTNFTYEKGIFYSLAAAYTSLVMVVVILQPWLKQCTPYISGRFQNPAYDDSPCRHTRTVEILYLTVEECAFGRRIVSSVILGGIIGWERREADRPAGIRTMALVSLGACLFTLTGTFAFITGTNEWDASRVSAAIPSGVGFLGAALIFKQADKDEFGNDTHTVHGLTTAASVWLSAAVGIACGGEMYFSASYTVAVMLLVLRFGPRALFNDEDQSSAVLTYENLDPEKMGLVAKGNRDSALTNSQISRRSMKPQLV